MQLRTCGRCRWALPEWKFYRRAASGKRHTVCKMCRRETQRKSRKRHASRRRLAGLRFRSAKSGIGCDLTAEQLDRLMAITHCQLSGIRLDSNGKAWNGIHIDRIDCTKGYTIGNVRVVARCINQLIGNWGVETVMPAVSGLAKRGRECGGGQ